tara:strand:+ start:14 stop:1717 length:1704 start_codon:yes stop_codon:yes gene_type:complete
MYNSSDKSKGYMPVPSGPNMTGFDMGKTSSLMEMMQTGGQTTRGGALLARALQMQSDQRRLEEAQRAEAKRQKRGGLFGSIGGLAGGLLGAALAPVTGGASLALAAGLGTALGKRAGEGLGAGKSRSVDRSGTVFGQQSFRDVEKASRDYTRGMGERALLSGLQAAATAGFSPGGGIYGKVAGRLNPSSISSLTEFSSGVAPTASGSVIPASADAEMLGDVVVPEFDTSLTDVSDMVLQPTEDAYQASLANALSLGEDNTLLDAARTAQAAQATAEEASRSAGSLIGYLERQELGPLADSLRMAPAPSMDPSLTEVVSPYFNLPMSPNRAPSMNTPSDASFIASYLNRLPRFEDGGLIGYNMGGSTSGGEGDDDTAEQTGTGIVYTDPDVDTGAGDDDTGVQTGTGTSSTNVPFIGSSLTAEGILEQQGLEATPEQLALFQRFDPTGIQSATQATGESLLGMTGGQGLASVGGGFGSQQIAVSQAVGQAQQSLEGQIEAEQRGFESQTLGTAADILAGGGEFSVAESVPMQPPTSPPSSPLANHTWIQTGPDGRTYLWTGSQWVPRG